MAENTKPVLAPKPVLSPKPGSNATESGGAEMTKEEMVAKFKGVTGKTVPEQARYACQPCQPCQPRWFCCAARAIVVDSV